MVEYISSSPEHVVIGRGDRMIVGMDKNRFNFKKLCQNVVKLTAFLSMPTNRADHHVLGRRRDIIIIANHGTYNLSIIFNYNNMPYR